MCGRFNLTASGDEIAEEFGLDEVPALRPRFNIAPSQPIAVIGVQPRTGRRGLAELLWGFLPARAGAKPRRFINARSETAAHTPAFRDAFAQRRCLLPATGFYEWQRAARARPQPWLFRMADGRAFALAGLWEPSPGADSPAGCLILTTEPNQLAREVHDRMPAILGPADYAAWLDPGATRAAELLRVFPAREMTGYPVSTAVNDPDHDDPSCLAPVTPNGALRR